MIWVIETTINNKVESTRFINKGNAYEYWKIKVRELSFPDSIHVEVLNDGEDNA